MDKINEQMYKANIDLVDKNRILEEDKKILTKRINKATEYINENWGHWCSDHCKYATETINILQGRYVDNE